MELTVHQTAAVQSEIKQILSLLPETHSRFWLQMGSGREVLSNDLQTIEAVFSSKITGLGKANGESKVAYQQRLSDELPELKKLIAEAEAKRKGFTKHLDAVVDKCMGVEKAMKTNSEYTQLIATELQLRKELAEEANQVKALKDEEVAFRTHFINEFDRLTAEFRWKLARIITDAYTLALQSGEAESVITKAKECIGEAKAGIPVKFNRVLIDEASAKSIYQSIQPIPVADCKANAYIALQEKFTTFEHDLHNAELAIKHEQETFQAVIISEQSDLANQQAANILIAQAESFATIETPQIKSKRKIDCNGLTIKEATFIQAAFLANGAKAWEKVKAAPEKLTIAQQAAALDAIEIEVSGVRYKVEEK